MISSKYFATDNDRRCICWPARPAKSYRQRPLSFRGWLLWAVWLVSGVFGTTLNAQFCAPVNAPPAVPAGISATLGHDQRAYQTAVQPGGMRMTNPANRLAADFTFTGVDLKTASARWGIALAGYGYGEKLHIVRKAAPKADGNRLEYSREGLTEWYVNGPFGLEQGFTIPQRPGKSEGEPLTLAFAIGGDLVAVLDADAHGLTLEEDHVPVLRYRDLTVTDAGGHELRAWMEVAGNRLLIRVNDAGARYPLVIDPFFQAAELTSCNGNPGDEYGKSVTTNGDGTVVVAGAPYATGTCTTLFCFSGAAYVFLKSARFGWGSFTGNPAAAELISSDGLSNDSFGYSVTASSDGSTIVVGAPYAAIGPNGRQGAIYVFVEPSTGWSTAPRVALTQTAKLTASDGRAFDELGFSVRISGDGSTIAGGAFSETGPNVGQGATYVFVKPAGGWASSAETAKLTASERGADGFGASVAIDTTADTIVVGAPMSVGTLGAAYVFASGTAGWTSSTETAKLTAADGQNDDRLGFAVAVSGDGSIVAAGADATVGSNQEQGAAYVFERPATGWSNSTEAAKLTASDGALQDGLGVALGLSSDGATLAAAAPYANIGSNVAQGAVYVFGKPATGWATSTEILKFTNSNGEGDALFGYSVGVDNNGSNIVAGEPFPTVNANGAGAMYVFSGSAALPAATVSPTHLSIAGPVGLTTGAQSVTLTNKGTAPLNVASVVVAGLCSSTSCALPLTSSQNCVSASPLAPGAHCSESVSFAPTTAGSFTAALVFTDDSGGTAGATQSVSLSGKATKAETSTAIGSASTNPSMVGQTLTISFSVTPPSGDAVSPSGTVTVTAAPSKKSCTATLPASSCTLAVATASTQQIAARYTGDPNFAGSSSAAVSQTVKQATTSIVLVSTPNPSVGGQNVTFKATVVGIYGGTPTGSVTFRQGTTTLGTIALASARGSYTTSFQTSGTRSITATYSGDANFVASTSPAMSQVVQKATTKTALTSSLNPSIAGQSVTLTATVSPRYSGSPAGSVTFKLGAKTLATVTISGRKASHTTTTLLTGADAITATYGGSANFTGSSASVTQTVKP